MASKDLLRSAAVEDYSKAIFALQSRSAEPVSTTALAERLGITSGSVSAMLKKLDELGLVTHVPYRGVRLTGEGRRLALEVIRHHRLLERFLHEFLGYSWDEVHEEAERLEHFISERLEDRIAAKLGDPEVDPHGHLIPERSGAVPFRKEFPLLKWVCGVPAVISSVSDRDPSALREMQRLGLVPGVSLVIDPGTRNASLVIRIGGESDPVRLSQRLAGENSVVASPGSLPDSQ